jgi:hypothetical protein
VQPISGGTGMGAPVAAPGCRITAGQQATGVPQAPQPSMSGELAAVVIEHHYSPFVPGRHTGQPHDLWLAWQSSRQAGSHGHQGTLCCCKPAHPHAFGQAAALACPAGHSSVPTQACNKPQPMQPTSQPALGGQAGSSTGSGTSSSFFGAASTQETAPAGQGSRAGMKGWKMRQQHGMQAFMLMV